MWHDDVLDGYEVCELTLPGAGPAPGETSAPVASLVRRAPMPGRPARRRAVLYVHGWNDYFFQTHLADHLDELGYDFYAVDLRRYGRSLRLGQLVGFITDLADYRVELDAAADLIAADHDDLLVMGHSTGGLIAALWVAGQSAAEPAPAAPATAKAPSSNAAEAEASIADSHAADTIEAEAEDGATSEDGGPQHPGRDTVRAVVLNSPWLDLQGSAMVRMLGGPAIDRLGTVAPTSVLRLPDLGHYARTLHRTLEGEWDYDLALKATPGPPIRVGWLRAILLGHQRVAAGLGITVPVLVMCSTASDFSRRWHEGLRQVDTVLDVEQIAARATRLGSVVTVVRVRHGLHDLFLSPPPVRQAAMAELARWLRAYGPNER